MNRWILLLFFAGLASCADPRATAVDETTDETPDEIDEQPTGATTVISETGEHSHRKTDCSPLKFHPSSLVSRSN